MTLLRAAAFILAVFKMFDDMASQRRHGEKLFVLGTARLIASISCGGVSNVSHALLRIIKPNINTK